MTLTVRPLPRNFPPSLVAAIFDFDETIIDLEEQHGLADAALCREMGSSYDAMPEEFRFSSGQRIVDNIREMRTFFGWDGDESSLFEIRRRFFDQTLAAGDLKLMPGAEPVIRTLHEARVRLAITSSAVRSGIELILRRAGLLDCFELIVDGSEVKRGKPDPEAYQVTATRLAVAPETCIVFEDSTVGVAAAKAAGMFCIALRNPAARSAQNLDAADLVLDSFEQLDVQAVVRPR